MNEALPGSAGMRELWSALPDLASEARARCLEFEHCRKLAPDFTDKLKRAGVFKVLVPTDAGGLGGSLPSPPVAPGASGPESRVPASSI